MSSPPSGSVTLTWTPSEGAVTNVNHYVIYRNRDGGPFTEIARPLVIRDMFAGVIGLEGGSVVPNIKLKDIPLDYVVKWTDTTALGGHRYCYKVVARVVAHEGGQSEPSNELCISTGGGSDSTLSLAYAQSGGPVHDIFTLTWTAASFPDDTVSSYDVHLSLNGAPATLIGSVSGGTLTYQDNYLHGEFIAGEYSYYVVANSTLGSTSQSNTETTTILLMTSADSAAGPFTSTPAGNAVSPILRTGNWGENLFEPTPIGNTFTYTYPNAATVDTSKNIALLFAIWLECDPPETGLSATFGGITCQVKLSPVNPANGIYDPADQKSLLTIVCIVPNATIFPNTDLVVTVVSNPAFLGQRGCYAMGCEFVDPSFDLSTAVVVQHSDTLTPTWALTIPGLSGEAGDLLVSFLTQAVSSASFVVNSSPVFTVESVELIDNNAPMGAARRSLTASETDNVTWGYTVPSFLAADIAYGIGFRLKGLPNINGEGYFDGATNEATACGAILPNPAFINGQQVSVLAYNDKSPDETFVIAVYGNHPQNLFTSAQFTDLDDAVETYLTSAASYSTTLVAGFTTWVWGAQQTFPFAPGTQYAVQVN